VVDDGGHMLAFARMDGARPACAATALTKAVSAATFRQETGTLPVKGEPDVLLSLSIQNASGGKFTTLKGGVPIVIDGQVVGAVGVGGGTGEQDAEVAKAGIQALLDGLGKSNRRAGHMPMSRSSGVPEDRVRPVRLLQGLQFISVQLQGRGRERVVQVVRLRRADDRCRHSRLVEEPRQRHLCVRDTAFPRHLRDPVYHREVAMFDEAAERFAIASRHRLAQHRRAEALDHASR
jgi:uncharacterized protein GlcG (DUF336 family)